MLESLAKLIRYYILTSTSEAGSGHPTSSLSAVELMTVLFFGGFFRADLQNPDYHNNDRLIFSKGHASPLFYSLYAAAGAVEPQLLNQLRKFGSPLEGHPSRNFKYTEVPTGSLGQGLSVGVGMAIAAKYLDRLPYRTYVLLGDSEMAEGSVWEAIQIAARYKLDNLIGVLDVNRLGQRGETLYGHDLAAYEKRVSAFGWNAIVIDGHSLDEIKKAYESAAASDRPVMIIAKTLKGKGVSLLEDKNGWHGKPLKKEELEKTLDELGKVNTDLRGKVAEPEKIGMPAPEEKTVPAPAYKIGELCSTRKAYGNALLRLFPKFPNLVVLDAETGNSTFAETFGKKYPERFFEMYIAEQNMVGAAMGLARRGKIPFVSTFAAFLSRAADQIRMSQYAQVGVKYIGSHAGVSIGEDGPSQMGLEDISLFRALHGSVVLYPSDAASAEALVESAAGHDGIAYIRMTRGDTPVIYSVDEPFPIGGSKTLRESPRDKITLIGAGITLHECLSAAEELAREGIAARIIDLYSIKPIDEKTIAKAASETEAIITIEDHYPEGGIGEAVRSALPPDIKTPVYSLAVSKTPKSGKPKELLAYESIDKNAIIKLAKEITK